MQAVSIDTTPVLQYKYFFCLSELRLVS